ncbi:restriction endonuclease subunit S [Helicobacter pylori]|uniref:Restriction endonuclease subunit S n=1 Tax=Helicobacter pylori TaxID=210 RepID=A0A438PXJ5_HELPX|nr:restriction endonuclease subunit S [Helicobacter pylori]RVY30173.1 restriction endonuclease subunit S [Helicobacter pylori]
MSEHVKLSEVCEIINSNVDKKIKENEQKVKLCNFTDVYNNWAITKYTSKKFMKATATQNEINKFSLKKGYVAITKDSETKDDIGISTYIADNFDNVLLGYHCTLLKPNQKVLNGKFLNAYLNSFYGRKYFSNCASGSGQRYTLTIDIIKDLNIPLINIETQQKIARTLSILDQKIENNHKINELLHKILELLYEQYFVRFDFLDENNKPYQTSGGKMKFSKELNRLIPNDFEVKTLGDNPLCNIIKTGVTPFKQKVYYETKHIQETLSLNQGLKVSYNKRPNRANMQPAIYSVWFAKMKDTKKHLFLNHHMQSWIKESILSTGFCGLQCQKHTFEYIASTIKYSPFETRKNNLATGATQKAINIEALDYIFILIPNKKLLDNYSKITKPLYEKISNNIIETQTLTALRDFLLPLLLKQQVKPK